MSAQQEKKKEVLRDILIGIFLVSFAVDSLLNTRLHETTHFSFLFGRSFSFYQEFSVQHEPVKTRQGLSFLANQRDRTDGIIELKSTNTILIL